VEIILYALACIGLLSIIWFVILPLCYMTLYAIGFMIFNLLHLRSWKVFYKIPYVAVMSFVQGLIECITLPVTRTSSNKWIWTPFFGYERKQINSSKLVIKK